MLAHPAVQAQESLPTSRCRPLLEWNDEFEGLVATGYGKSYSENDMLVMSSLLERPKDYNLCT
jgi:hypothetical protein